VGANSVGLELPCAFQCVADGVEEHDSYCPAHYEHAVDAALATVTRERDRWEAREHETSGNLSKAVERAEAAEARCSKLEETLTLMISYLGHEDQDADHLWMVMRMREALRPNAAGSATDLFHPFGRCTCAGEGRCAWCRRYESQEGR
jgi:hypothetical protein